MKDDYEIGLQRGRYTRHKLGRMRWLMLISVMANFFLLYKLWDDTVQISSLKTRGDVLSKSINENSIKETRCEKLISELQDEKDLSKTRLAENEDLIGRCRRKNNECAENLDSTSSKLEKTSDDFHKLMETKEQMTTRYEQCATELDELRELVQTLRVNIDTEQKKIEDCTPGGGNIEPHEKSGPVQRTVEQKREDQIPVLKEVGNKMIEEEEGNRDEAEDDDSVLNIIVSCPFSENLERPKCDYTEESRIPEENWKIGHSDVIGHQDKTYVKFLYIDDSYLPSEVSAGIAFLPVRSKNCVLVSLTVMTVGSGTLLIEDQEQIFKVSSNPSETGHNAKWESKDLVFKPAKVHVIKLHGKVPTKGAVGISVLSISEVKCSKTENDPPHTSTAIKTLIVVKKP